MLPQSLLDTIKTTLKRTKVDELATIAAKENYSVKELIDMTFHEDEQIGFRCAWILEHIYTNHFNRFLPVVPYFLGKFSTQNNLSCRRHYGKILALMTKKNAPVVVKEIIHNYNTDELVETVFSWLIDEQVPVAVKSHCLNILANLCEKHHWVKAELLHTIDFLIDKESIAFYGKAKKIRKQLGIGL